MAAVWVTQRGIPGLLLVQPVLYRDGRGALFEMYNREAYRQAGITDEFVQENLSRSVKDVVRGLHFQRERPQAKLITCAEGAVYDVALDLRPESPFFGHWAAMTLSAEKGNQAYLPAGFAHGFAALTETAVVLYKCSAFYDPEDQHGVNPADPDLAIPWPAAGPIFSERDRNLPSFARTAEILGRATNA